MARERSLKLYGQKSKTQFVLHWACESKCMKPAVPKRIVSMMTQRRWINPGPERLRSFFANTTPLPDMMLFETVELIEHVSDMLEAGGYVDNPEFCMVRSVEGRTGSDDVRLVFAQAVFIAGSTVPGDDVFIAVSVRSDAPVVAVFDWSAPIPNRWRIAMTLEEFCDELVHTPENR